MVKLAEIQAAADALPPGEKQDLLLYLIARLRATGGQMPAPRRFTPEQMKKWLADDEADADRSAGGQAA